MPYVRPTGAGATETISIAHQPLALPRTKHRKRAESASTSSSEVPSSVLPIRSRTAEHQQVELVEGETVQESSSAVTEQKETMPDFGSMVSHSSVVGGVEDVLTPRAGSTPPLSIPHYCTTAQSSRSRIITASPSSLPQETGQEEEGLASALPGTSLESVAPSLSTSSRQSPSEGTSIGSLSDQDQGSSTSVSRRNSGLAHSFDDHHQQHEEQGHKVADEEEQEGTDSSSSPPTSMGTPSPAQGSGLRLDLGISTPEMEAIARYRQGLLAYTNSLYIQAQLSNSRAEKKRQGAGYEASFGLKQSGMERMAAKKALARRLNG